MRLSLSRAVQPPPDPGATVVAAPVAAPRSAGLVSVGTVVVVVAALCATVLGGGLASRKSDLLDGNTWVLGVERVLRINPGSGQVDVQAKLPKQLDGPGHDLRIEQSNVTTAVVDATSGDTYTWNAGRGDFQRSSTRIAGNNALHLTSKEAFSVDRGVGTVRRLDPQELATVGSPLRIGTPVNDSVVDGAGTLWLSAPATRQVLAVRADGATDPRVKQRFALPLSGTAPRLTALRSGIMLSEAGGTTAYRVRLGRGASERITTQKSGGSAQSAASSDDDTSAVLDPRNRRVTRVAPKGDRRAASYSLGTAETSHQFGQPVVFADRVYVPDYTAGKVLRTDSDGRTKAFISDAKGTPGRLQLFVDDGRLWVNSPSGARAYYIDRSGNYTPILKTGQRVKPPSNVEKGAPTAKPTGPATTKSTGPTKPAAGRQTRSTPRAPSPPAKTKQRSKPTKALARVSSAPTELRATGGDRSVRLSWSPPQVRPGTVTGYRISRVDASGADRRTRSVGSGTKDLVVKGVSNGTTYIFAVVALTGSKASSPATIRAVPGTKPGVTLDLTPWGPTSVMATLHVDAKGSGSAGCRVFVNSEKIARAYSYSCNGEVRFEVTKLYWKGKYTFYAQAYNKRGISTTPRASLSKWPDPLVEFFKGAEYHGSKCHDPSCRWIRVIVHNLRPRTTYDLTVVEARSHQGKGDPFPHRTITTNDDGWADRDGPNTFFYGHPNREIHVQVSRGTDVFASKKQVWRNVPSGP